MNVIHMPMHIKMYNVVIKILNNGLLCITYNHQLRILLQLLPILDVLFSLIFRFFFTASPKKCFHSTIYKKKKEKKIWSFPNLVQDGS